MLSQGADALNKDFCLFTPGSRYVIVASSQAVRVITWKDSLENKAREIEIEIEIERVSE